MATIKNFRVERDGNYHIVTDDIGNVAAGPYKTAEQAHRNLDRVCWGDAPELGVELF